MDRPAVRRLHCPGHPGVGCRAFRASLGLRLPEHALVEGRDWRGACLEPPAHGLLALQEQCRSGLRAAHRPRGGVRGGCTEVARGGLAEDGRSAPASPVVRHAEDRHPHLPDPRWDEQVAGQAALLLATSIISPAITQSVLAERLVRQATCTSPPPGASVAVTLPVRSPSSSVMKRPVDRARGSVDRDHGEEAVKPPESAQAGGARIAGRDHGEARVLSGRPQKAALVQPDPLACVCQGGMRVQGVCRKQEREADATPGSPFFRESRFPSDWLAAGGIGFRRARGDIPCRTRGLRLWSVEACSRFLQACAAPPRARVPDSRRGIGSGDESPAWRAGGVGTRGVRGRSAPAALRAGRPGIVDDGGPAC